MVGRIRLDTPTTSPCRLARVAVTLGLLVITMAVGPSSAAAHEFWIEPSAWRVSCGERVDLVLRVGEALVGDPVPRRARHLARFVSVGPSATTEIPGLSGGHPAGFVRPATAGWHVIGYESRRSFVVLAAEKFDAYLVEEGLESIRARRARAGQNDEPGREAFRRCAKTLLRIGDTEATPQDRILGLPLEVVLVAWDASERRATFETRYRGEPLAGTLVCALRRGSSALEQRSDAQGRVAFELDAAGPWIVDTVHMVKAPASTGADWDSLWASLTFELEPSDSVR